VGWGKQVLGGKQETGSIIQTTGEQSDTFTRTLCCTLEAEPSQIKSILGERQSKGKNENEIVR
jgi:hypothetical protein